MYSLKLLIKNDFYELKFLIKVNKLVPDITKVLAYSLFLQLR